MRLGNLRPPEKEEEEISSYVYTICRLNSIDLSQLSKERCCVGEECVGVHLLMSKLKKKKYVGLSLANRIDLPHTKHDGF